MKKTLVGLWAIVCLIPKLALAAPLDTERLPPGIRPELTVHYVSVDGAFTPTNANWHASLKVLSGGDQTTEAVTIAGHTGVKVKGMKFNTADELYSFWSAQHEIDILMQVYGDAALVDEKGNGRYCNFLTGTLPEPIAVDGGTISPESKNGRWNWVLFRIPNGLRHMDGGRLVGTIHPKARTDSKLAEVSRRSGQNGGTIRLDGLHDLKVRFVAFGQKGSFGEPDEINQFGK